MITVSGKRDLHWTGDMVVVAFCGTLEMLLEGVNGTTTATANLQYSTADAPGFLVLIEVFYCRDPP